MINLPFPIPTNALYRNVKRADGQKGKGRALSKRYRAWRKEAGWTINGQSLIGEVPYRPPETGPYNLEITVQRVLNKDGSPSKVKRDLDNLAKGISDLLVEMQITPDDHLMQSLTVRWSDAVEGPTVRVKAGG